MDRPFGLLNIIDLPFYAEFIIGFLLMDLSFYYWHRINHVVPLLWRFHNVHHLDPDLDASTSFRFHFIEILYSALFRVGQIMLIGMSAPTFIIYELVFQFVTIFHHSNLRLPIRLERVINYIFVTPRMHGLHHSTIKNETNSNYAVIIRWWDYLNKSLKLNVRQSDIVTGVPGYLKETDNNLVNLLALPFQSQRQYWRSPDGSKPKREEIASSRYFMLE
jgi:sterol desaturase/sphingolipid hydroxylase (fatty acid hydroxylase superfamily)